MRGLWAPLHLHTPAECQPSRVGQVIDPTFVDFLRALNSIAPWSRNRTASRRNTDQDAILAAISICRVRVGFAELRCAAYENEPNPPQIPARLELAAPQVFCSTWNNFCAGDEQVEFRRSGPQTRLEFTMTLDSVGSVDPTDTRKGSGAQYRIPVAGVRSPHAFGGGSSGLA